MGLPSHFSLVPAQSSSRGSWFQSKATAFIRPLMNQHVFLFQLQIFFASTSSWQKLSRVIQKFGAHTSSVESQTITSQISLIRGRSHLYWAITVCLSRQLWLKIMTVSAVDVIEIHLLVHWASFLGMLSKQEKMRLHNMIYWKLISLYFINNWKILHKFCGIP